MSAFLTLAERLADLPLTGEDARKADYIIGQALDERRMARHAAGDALANIGSLKSVAEDIIHKYTRRAA